MPNPHSIAIALAFLALTALAASPAGAAAPTAPAAPVAAAPVVAATEKLNLNAATKEALLAVPGIGPRTAQAIVDLRTRKGGFQRIEDLLEVRGIGQKNLKELAKHLVVPPAAPVAAASSK